ncbi:hypothetical protein [Halobacillus sp. KGW1]|uniref:hypothetical protein n=1 Tax=Halobacillus sp. KGW1 TaxID=1793726 RepID=UPI0007822398|nr:hypothetical protein [Halobacillus sp. KGW1]
MAKPAQKTQIKKIDEEKKKLLELFKDISEEKKKVAERLIERVAFMTITLEILEDDIQRKGPTYKFTQGSQSMYVENPAQRSYNTMINRYTSAVEKLFNILPKEEAQVKDDGFDEFMERR